MIFYTGSYTQDGSPAPNPQGKGIACFSFNLKTGAIELLHYTNQRNPSYMVISDDKKYLYAIEEMFESLNPKIYAYRIKENGKLSLLNSQDIAGDYACHLAIVKNKLLVANYVSGNILSYSILNDGSLAACQQVLQHEGTGPNKERQEAAHAHMVCPFGKDQMYIVDLGLDKAKAYYLDKETNKWKVSPKYDIQIELGSGARHMIMDAEEQFSYVLSELTGEIYTVSKQNGKNKVIQKISFIPENYDGEFGGAAIRLHPNGKYLYASCRGTDSITTFKLNEDTKCLELLGIQSSEGETPRDFNIDPTGKYLIAANQDSNSLVVFEIDKKTGLLKKTSTFSVETPVNICWLN